MTIAELHQNEELRHDEFPVTRTQAYLAHAGVCPLPRRVAHAMANCALNGSLSDQEEAVSRTFIAEARATAASLIQADASEIAFVGPTSLALSHVAAGFNYRRSQNVLIYHDDYPANVYPWMALADRGIEVRLMNIRELGKIRDIDVMGQVDENTKLVALASCHFIGGWRLNIPVIGKALRQRGILFCVDAIQTLGAFPFAAADVDILAADAHKWLLGPCAAGILYVRKAVQEELRPVVHGWHNVRCPDFVAQEQIQFRNDARRYEAGSANLIGLVGLKTAMELLMDFGIENIAAELMRKRAWLVPVLQEKGYAVLHASPPPENAGAIVSFYRPNEDMAELHQKLAGANIMTSLRKDRSGRQFIRVSPHFYNTDDELRRLLDGLP